MTDRQTPLSPSHLWMVIVFDPLSTFIKDQFTVKSDSCNIFFDCLEAFLSSKGASHKVSSIEGKTTRNFIKQWNVWSQTFQNSFSIRSHKYRDKRKLHSNNYHSRKTTVNETYGQSKTSCLRSVATTFINSAQFFSTMQMKFNSIIQFTVKVYDLL
jgi:hypothetical protein